MTGFIEQVNKCLFMYLQGIQLKCVDLCDINSGIRALIPIALLNGDSPEVKLAVLSFSKPTKLGCPANQFLSGCQWESCRLVAGRKCIF